MRPCNIHSTTTNVLQATTIPRARTQNCPRFSLLQRCPLSTLSTSLQHGCTSPSAFWNTILSRTINISDRSYLYLSALERDRTVLKWCPNTTQARAASTTSNSKWLSRQSSDPYTRQSKLLNLKSRAAFKLLQLNEKHKLFKPGMTVVDLGYAPGSWSQVAIDLVKPGVGRVIGVDIIPIQPPKGVSGLQGDFLSQEVQDRVREFVRDAEKGRMKKDTIIIEENAGHVDTGTHASSINDGATTAQDSEGITHEGGVKCVDIVLSDMSAPWDILSGTSFKNTIGNPYRRMMNTTGNKFRDHAGSMDLCRSALYFCHSTLKPGGSFVCKFYQGAEDSKFEKQLKALFEKVHREKPESSRSESREGFFVARKRRKDSDVDVDKVFDEG